MRLKYPRFCSAFTAGAVVEIVYGILANSEHAFATGFATLIFVILTAVDLPGRAEKWMS